MHDWGRLEGLIPILGGTYVFLLARGVLPVHPKHPEKAEEWRQTFGGLMTVIAQLAIAQLFGALR